MKCKLFCLVLFMAAFPLFGKAQVYAGGSFSILHSHGTTVVNIAPEVGYNLNSKWAVAGKLNYYNYDGTNAFSIAPYVRYSFFERGIFSLFADGYVEMYWNDPDVSFGVGVTPGMAMKATEHLSFFLC